MTYKRKNLRILNEGILLDRKQAITQLEALGYSREDTIYVKAFLPKENLRYAPNTGRKANKLLWEQIRWRSQGYTVTERCLKQTESVGYATLGGTR